MRAIAVTLLALTTSLLAATAAAAPTGWVVKESGPILRLEPEGLPAGAFFEAQVLPPEPGGLLAGAYLEVQLRRPVASLGRLQGCQSGEASDADFAYRACGLDPALTGGEMVFAVAAAVRRPDRQNQLLVVLLKDSDLLKSYAPQLDALFAAARAGELEVAAAAPAPAAPAPLGAITEVEVIPGAAPEHSGTGGRSTS